MDTSRGEFVEDSRAEKWMKRLEVGQVVKVLEEEFEVKEISKRTILLQMLSAEDRFVRNFDALASNRAAEIERHRDRMLNGKG